MPVKCRPNCIHAHKPNINMPVGNVWTCPTCAREYIRVEKVANSVRYTWEWRDTNQVGRSCIEGCHHSSLVKENTDASSKEA